MARVLFWGSPAIGRHSAPEGKRDSEGLGQLSRTEAWNWAHLLLHPAFTLVGLRLWTVGGTFTGVWLGHPLRTVPDRSSSTSETRGESSFTPTRQATVSGGKQLEMDLPTATWPTHAFPGVPSTPCPAHPPRGQQSSKLRRHSSQRLCSHLQTLPGTASRLELQPQAEPSRTHAL